MLGTVPGCRLIKMVYLVSDPVVGIEDVGIVSQKFFCGIKYRGDGIAHCIFRIIYKLHAVKIRKIIKLFLQVSHHDGDILYARSMKLLYLPLYHGLSEDLKKALRSLISKGHEAGAEARRKDDGLLHLKGLKIGKALLRNTIA